MMITSTSNSKIKDIRKLRDRKERRLQGVFYVEGLRHVMEVASLGLTPEIVIYSPDMLTSQNGWRLVNQWSDHSITMLEVSEEDFRSISVREDSPGIAVVMRQRWVSIDTIQPGTTDTWVALDSVADPGNLGTILRTGDATGTKGVILLDQCTDPYDASAVRASMGSIFSQKVSACDFHTFAEWKKKMGCPVIGTSDKARLDYQELDYPTGMVLLMGSERQGLQDHHLNLCDEVVRVPMAGRCDSLNLAVATSVILYEIYHQKRKRQGV